MAIPRAVLFFGPPGSGKTTQAEEFVHRFSGFRHLNIGQIIEKRLSDSKYSDDPKLRVEKEAFESGGLISSQFIIQMLGEWVTMVAKEGSGVVFSGNPRRLEEAEFLIPVLEKLYGEGTIYAVHLSISEETTYKRNTHRRVCTKCALPVAWGAKTEHQAFCKRCGGALDARIIDTNEAIKKRLQAYREITERVIPFLKASSVSIIEVDGEKSQSEISEEIETVLTSVNT